MSERNWSDVVREVIDDSIKREEDEADKFEAEAESYIRFVSEMTDEQLLVEYENNLQRGYSNVRKNIVKQKLIDAFRAEIKRRLNNAN